MIFQGGLGPRMAFQSNSYILDSCWSLGDGQGEGIEKKLGVAANREECKTLVMTSEPSANGATFPSSNNAGDCFAEFGMYGANSNNKWQTCLFYGKTISYHLSTLRLLCLC